MSWDSVSFANICLLNISWVWICVCSLAAIWSFLLAKLAKSFHIVFDLDNTLIDGCRNRRYVSYNISKSPLFKYHGKQVFVRCGAYIVPLLLSKFFHVHLNTRAQHGWLKKIFRYMYPENLPFTTIRVNVKHSHKDLSYIDGRAILIDDRSTNNPQSPNVIFYHISPFLWIKQDIELYRLLCYIMFYLPFKIGLSIL